MMTCVDCGFEFDSGNVCPRCGYDASMDLLQCISMESPQVSSGLEQELVALSKRVNAGELSRDKLQEQWKIIGSKAKAGDLDARHLIGRSALMRQDYDLARKVLSPLAAAGHALAQLDLAKIHEEGLGGEPNAFDAIRLCRQSATRGNPLAIFRLAERYGKGDGIRQNVLLANAVMSQLVTTYPTMFQRKPGCGGRSCDKILTDREFAMKTAFQMSKMFKYLVMAAVLSFAAYVILTEFFGG